MKELIGTVLILAGVGGVFIVAGTSDFQTIVAPTHKGLSDVMVTVLALGSSGLALAGAKILSKTGR
ncbi:MAG: hypothetical protein AAB596_00220 [Patescibacteria group bacterium]